MGLKGRQLVQQEFSLDTVIDKHFRLYEKLLSE
jgi:hypothetical protein